MSFYKVFKHANIKNVIEKIQCASKHLKSIQLHFFVVVYSACLFFINAKHLTKHNKVN